MDKIDIAVEQTPVPRVGGITILEGLTKHWWAPGGMEVVSSDCFGGFYRAGDDVAALASQSQAAQPTDISQRLRERAGGGYTAVRVEDGALMLAAAREIERLAGTSQATKAQAEPLGYISVPAFEMLKSKRAVSIAITPESNAERVAIYAAPVAKGAPAVPEAVIAKWMSLRGNVVTCAINGTATYFPPEDTNELLNVFDAALPAKSDDEDSEVVASVAKEAEKEQQAKPIAAAVRAAERVDAMHKGVVGVFAAIKAEHIVQAHVMPPSAAPAGQSGASTVVLSNDDIEHAWDRMPGQPGGFLKSFGYYQFAREIESEVVRRFRAQGGNTNTESSDAAPTTSTVSAPAHDELVRMYRRHEEWARSSSHDPMGWEDFQASRLENPLSRRAIEFATNPDAAKYGEAKIVGSTEGAQAAPEEVRNQALEDAAAECEDQGRGTNSMYRMACIDCAESIRSFKTHASTAQANADTDTGSAA